MILSEIVKYILDRYLDTPLSEDEALCLFRLSKSQDAFVTPLLQKIFLDTGVMQDVLEDFLIDLKKIFSQKCFLWHDKKTGLLHIKLTDEILFQDLVNQTKRNLSQGAISLVLPNAQSERLNCWADVFKKISKTFFLDFSLEFKDLPKGKALVNGYSFSVNTFLDVSVPNIQLPTAYAFVASKRLNTPVSYRSHTYTCLDNPAFIIFYAHNLITLCQREMSSPVFCNKPLCRQSIASESFEKEGVFVLLLLYLYKLTATSFLRKGHLFHMFSHFITLCEGVIKWYDACCVWEGNNNRLLDERIRLLNLLEMEIKEGVGWIGLLNNIDSWMNDKK